MRRDVGDADSGGEGVTRLGLAERHRARARALESQARAVPLSSRAIEALDQARVRWGASGFIFSADRLSSLGNLAADTREAVARAGCTVTDFHVGPRAR